MNKPTVIYLCNAIDEFLRLKRNIITDSPAATNKVNALTKAMQIVGLKCITLSLGRGRQNGDGSWYSAQTSRNNGSITIYCSFLNLPILTHLITALNLATILFFLSRRNSNITLLVYNRSYHYLPALIVARVFKISSFLDLEDGYNNHKNSKLRAIKNLFTSKLFNWLCPDGNIVANSGLGSQLNQPIGLICYGAILDSYKPKQDWQSEKLRIIFSGNLVEELGCSLFIDAIKILIKKYPFLISYFHFFVSGKGPYSNEFEFLSAKYPNFLSFKKLLSRNDYLDLVGSCHFGLSLRLSNFEMSSTTFPSKIIEYSEYGLVLITTRVSDVPLIFGDSAIYLENETSEELADLFLSLFLKRNILKNMALISRNKVFTFCNAAKVGSEIRQLLKI